MVTGMRLKETLNAGSIKEVRMTKFAKVYEIDQNWTKYDKSVAECQLANYGCVYIDEYGDEYGCPIDDENMVEAMFEHDRVKKCCICGKEFTGFGNNPEPVKHDGECCNECNMSYVLQARVKALAEYLSQNEEYDE